MAGVQLMLFLQKQAVVFAGIADSTNYENSACH